MARLNEERRAAINREKKQVSSEFIYRKRGRPPLSPNTKKQRLHERKQLKSTTTTRRGRPPGSKSKFQFFSLCSFYFFFADKQLTTKPPRQTKPNRSPSVAKFTHLNDLHPCNTPKRMPSLYNDYNFSNILSLGNLGLLDIRNIFRSAAINNRAAADVAGTTTTNIADVAADVAGTTTTNIADVAADVAGTTTTKTCRLWRPWDQSDEIENANVPELLEQSPSDDLGLDGLFGPLDEDDEVFDQLLQLPDAAPGRKLVADAIIGNEEIDDTEVDNNFFDFETNRNGIYRSFQGFIYRRALGKVCKNSTRSEFWRCKNQQAGCAGRLDCKSAVFRISTPHNCQPNPETSLHLQVIANMKRRCRTEYVFVTRIYEEEKAKVIAFKFKKKINFVFL